MNKSDRITASKNATERANLAEERLQGWNMLMNGLRLLEMSYAGNDLHETIVAWRRSIAEECSARRPHLREIATKERESARFQLEMYSNEES